MVEITGPYNLPYYNKDQTGILWGNVRQHIWVPFRIKFPLKEVFPFKVKSKSIKTYPLPFILYPAERWSSNCRQTRNLPPHHHSLPKLWHLSRTRAPQCHTWYLGYVQSGKNRTKWPRKSVLLRQEYPRNKHMGWHWENIRHDKEHRQEGINRKSDLPYASWQNRRWLRLHDKCRFFSLWLIFVLPLNGRLRQGRDFCK